jgi:hypothetical protein
MNGPRLGCKTFAFGIHNYIHSTLSPKLNGFRSVAALFTESK